MKSSKANMRQYQSWLEHKSYSSHLNNLIRIRNGKTHRNNYKLRPNTTYKNYSIHNKSQLQKKDKQIIKEFKPSTIRNIIQINLVIKNQNNKLINEKKEQQSTVSKDTLKQNLFRNDIKSRNLNRFFKLKKKGIIYNIHRFTFHLRIKSLTKCISWQSSSEIWCELEIRPKMKSQYIRYNSQNNLHFTFHLQYELPLNVICKIYGCRRLQSCQIGQFILKVPKINQKWQGKIFSQIDHTKNMIVQISYNAIQIKDKQNYTLQI